MPANPYVLSDADSAIFTAHPPAQDGQDVWSEECYSEIRERIKRYCIEQQNNQCCYCRRTIQSDNLRVWDLEHVLSREQYPNFVFEPRNLAVSCVDCNIAKGTKQAGKSSTYVHFPNGSASYHIVHPYLDDYPQHIGRVAGLVYYAKNGSTKGTFTIRTCNLDRFARAFDKSAGPVADERFEVDVARLLSSRSRDDALAAARKLLTAFDSGELE